MDHLTTLNMKTTHLSWDLLYMRKNTCASNCRKWISIICRNVKHY